MFLIKSKYAGKIWCIFNHTLMLPNIVTLTIINHLHVVDLPIKMSRVENYLFQDKCTITVYAGYS